MIWNNKYYLTLLFVLSFGCIGNAQLQPYYYEGIREAKGIPLVEQYEFIIRGKDTIPEGTYALKKSVFLDGVLNEYDFFSVEGFNKMGQKVGKWRIREGALRPAGIGTIDQYLYTFKVEGRENVFKGDFQNGVKNGEWLVYQWDIANSEIQDTLLEANVTYIQDVLQGNTYLRKGDIAMYFDITSSGEISGIWNIMRLGEDSEVIEEENWYFEQGFLTRKEYKKDKETHVLHLDNNFSEFSSSEWIEFGDDFFRTIHLKKELEIEFGNQSFPSQLTIKGVENFHYFEDILRQGDFVMGLIEGIPFSRSLKTKIKKNIFSQQDSLYLREMQSLIQDLDSSLVRFYEDKAVQLAKNSLQPAQECIAILETLRDERGGQVDDFLSAYSSGLLEKLNVEYFVRQVISFDRTLLYRHSEEDKDLREYTLSTLSELESGNTFAQLVEHCQHLIMEAEILIDSVQTIITKIQKEESIVLMEESLRDLHAYWVEKTNYLEDNEIESIAKFDVGEKIKDYLDQQLEDYFKILNLEKRVETINYYKDCIAKVEPLISHLSSLVLNTHAIEDAYISQVFNPYTFTNMEDIAKPAIYNAYQDLLLPSILGNLHDLRCDNLESTAFNFTILFKSMQDFLIQETSKKERKLRKVKEPIKAAEILGITLDYN
jgi:hypothetical protein